MNIRWYLLPLPILAACGYGELQPADKLYRESEQLWRRGLNRQALKLVDKGWRQWRSRPDSDWHWKFRLLEAELLVNEGSIQSAGELLGSEPAAPPSGELQARYLSLLALVRRDPALVDQAFEIASHGGDAALLLSIELKRADLDGYSSRSQAFLRNALSLGRKQSDKYWEARALGDSGYQLLHASRFDEAVPPLEQGEALARQAGADRVRERILGSLGWCYSRLGDSDRALRALSLAIELARQVEDDSRLYRWLNDIGGVYFKRHEYAKAISYYHSAANLARGVNNETWLTMMLDNLAATSLESGDLAAAERYNGEAAALIQKDNNTASLLHAQLNTAGIETARNQGERAEASYREVIDSAARQGQPFVRWEAQAGLARLLQSGHRDAEADHQYRDALATIESEWSRLGEDRHKVTFLAQLIPFYEDYVDFLAGRGETARAAEIADSSRARVLAQRLEEDSSRTFQPARPGKGGPILLSYWLTPARSYLWVMGGKRVEQFILPGEAHLAGLVNQYAAAIDRGHDPIERDNPAGRRLYRELIAPAQALIPAGASVIVVPDGCLHRLNFETLIADDPVPHYWIEDVTLAVAPALGLLQAPPSRRGAPGKMLFLGDPAPADPAFPRLPHLAREAEIVRRSFAPPVLTLLTREEAYPQAYQAAHPGDYALIHFAAHAVANAESPLDSAVILSKSGDDYKLYARDVMEHPLHAEMVTLSACRSAGARSYEGEGLLGFTWAFLNAGARNVIAGLWEADDAATAELMDEFYSRLVSGSSPAAALRIAKLKLLKSRGRNRTPYYWGPLALFTRDSELRLPDRNLTRRAEAVEADLVGARLQAGGRK
jgi:CHAT domain-containing protein